MRKLAVSVFDLLDTHAFSQARKNKRDRKSGSSDGEFPAQQLGIRDDPAIFLERLEFLLHLRSLAPSSTIGEYPAGVSQPPESNIFNCSFGTDFGLRIRRALPTTPNTSIADNAAFGTNTR
jgi:hypothetical protein